MVTIKGNDDQEDKHCNNMKALVGIQMQQNLILKKRDTENEVDDKRDGTTVQCMQKNLLMMLNVVEAAPLQLLPSVEP